MTSKTTKTKATATAVAPQPAPRRRRRRRRRTNALLSQRLITEVNQKKRTFLREVSTMLTDALGFEVRVSLVNRKPDFSPDMRRAARMTKKQARRQMADAAQAPVVPGKPASKPARRGKAGELNDGIPF